MGIPDLNFGPETEYLDRFFVAFPSSSKQIWKQYLTLGLTASFYTPYNASLLYHLSIGRYIL
jgi:hypothetical protein